MEQYENFQSLNIKSKNRIIEIDYLKAFAIFLVVWGHFFECFLYSYSTYIYHLIYMFHMPLFVFISGYLSKFKYKDLIKFGIICLVFHFIYGLFNCYILGKSFNFNVLYPYWSLWYLFAMIIWKLTLPLIEKISNKYQPLVLVILFLFGICAGTVSSINRFLCLSRTIAFYPFFVLGYFNKKSGRFGFNLKLSNTFKIIILTAVLITFALLTKLIKFSNSAFYMNDPYNGFSHSALQRLIIYIFALSVIILLTSISLKKNNKLIELLSRNTLTVYLLHVFITFTFKKYHLFSSSNFSIFTSLLLSIIIVLLLSLIGELILITKKKIIAKYKQKHQNNIT